jgi:formate dehydrogenase iron-sulfur subunit
MTTTIYVPRDSAALSVGADAVAEAIRREADVRGLDIRLVRNGSRGMLWLEPFVEIDTPEGRVGYGPVAPHQVPELLDNPDHELKAGLVDDLKWMKDQTRLCFQRVGVTDPLSADDYLAHGGMAGLRNALELEPQGVVTQVTDSGLRGRGGAGFPAGIKWNTVLNTPGELKFICCNADEGDSGTFADRMLIEGDPFCLIEGMATAAYATGATEGYVYLRSEYPDAVRRSCTSRRSSAARATSCRRRSCRPTSAAPASIR